MLENLLLNPITKAQLAAFAVQPGQALLIHGAPGSGKVHIARALAAEILNIQAAALSNYPYFISITRQEDKSEISIDEARALIRKLSLRVPGQTGATIRRIALIDDAGRLSTEAQNALLKLLEEPPAGSLLVLTAESEDSVLPTVSSRLQKLKVLPLELEASLAGLDYDPKEVEAAWRLSGGGARLMLSLLSEDENHPLKSAVQKAKDLISQTPYQRVIFLQGLSKDKTEFKLFLTALSKVLAALHASNINSGNQANSARLLKARQQVQAARESSEKNTSLRLLALNLAVSIPL